MDKLKAEAILIAAKTEFENLYEDETDAVISMVILVELVKMLTSPMYLINEKGLPVVMVNNLPTADKKFCEVLRVLANVFELAIEAQGDK